jgi:PAS domain S-box-containing protein
MAGTVACLALHDAQATEGARATACLQDALAPVTSALSAHFDPAVRELNTLRQWAASGLLTGQHTTQWAAIILPVLSPLDTVGEFYLVKENGACLHLSRDARGWFGSSVDPASPDAALRGTWWDPQGTRLESGQAREVEGDVRLSSWYGKALALQEQDERSPLVVETDERSVILATPLQFSGGQRGCVALMLTPAPDVSAHSSVAGLDLFIDPRGERIGQIQDLQTLSLLASQAVPGDGNAALSRLFPESGADAWYGASSYVFNDSCAWWVIGRVATDALPLPALPLLSYVGWAFGVGLLGALVLALVFGHRITRPLRQVAARARGIHVLDEHYLPWPTSRFTEMNVLTSALEEIYESAVEHLDYHEAPLIVWAQPEEAASDGMIDAEAVRHVFQFPRGNGKAAGEAPRQEAVIDVDAGNGALALPPVIPAAQLQVLHGTRKEVRRLQSQLAGAVEELRTADNHYQQDQARMKRQRNCLRGLERILLTEGGASPVMLSQVGEILGASRVSLWTQGAEANQFKLSGVHGSCVISSAPFTAPFTLLALLQGESLIAVQEPLTDPRLASLSSHDFFRGVDDPRMLVPVKLAGKLLGFLITERPGGLGRWKSDEELFTLGVANACAGVLWQQLRPRPVAPTNPLSTPVALAEWVRARNGKGARKSGTVSPGPASVVLFWEIDRAGCIKSIDGNVEAIYGRTRDQLVGQPLTFLSDPAQGQRDMERLAALLAGHRCKGYETCHSSADGSAVHLVVRAKVWRDASDRIVGARGSLEPVTVAVAT